MKATINSTGEVITGKTLDEIRRKLNSMLSIEGSRGLTATVEKTGAVIHVELYEGQDYIKTANGRIIKR